MNTDLHTIWIWHSYFAKLSSEFENGMERFFVTMAFFLQRQQSVEDRVHLDITAWWGAAEPSLALQGVITHPGVWHNVWSAQKVFTVRLLPPTTQIALQVSLIAPTHLFREISFKGLTDALIADLSLDHVAWIMSLFQWTNQWPWPKLTTSSWFNSSVWMWKKEV